MQKNIVQHIRNHVDLSDSEVEVLNKYFKIHHCKKKELLLIENKVCNQFYYVEKGCLRMYFINKKGVEQITQFALEGWWISDFQSFINGSLSEYYIQAVEESRIVSIDHQNLDALVKALPQLEKYFRLIMQKAVGGAQLRSKLLYEMSKEEFFVHFSTSFPEFMMRVPQYMIASYLGLTPEYLSELRKKTIL
ncbi:MAG: Crp/Fnr family transcriptional regulator [Bacteroidetes bacterium]|nr:Crp/Fnr family transcriptional regulator [Bacteroidota bacterium]